MVSSKEKIEERRGKTKEKGEKQVYPVVKLDFYITKRKERCEKLPEVL